MVAVLWRDCLTLSAELAVAGIEETCRSKIGALADRVAIFADAHEIFMFTRIDLVLLNEAPVDNLRLSANSTHVLRECALHISESGYLPN